MKRVVQLVGNGDNASLFFKEPRPGMKLTCNLPPFNVAGVYATVIVDFKFMKAIQDGSLQCPGDWILGMRPKIHMDRNPTFYVKHSHQVKEFYTELSYITREFVEYTTYVRALEMTTEEIIQNKELFLFDTDKYNDWIALLSKADMVKYAKQPVEYSEMIVDKSKVVKFIDDFLN